MLKIIFKKVVNYDVYLMISIFRPITQIEDKQNNYKYLAWLFLYENYHLMQMRHLDVFF